MKLILRQFLSSLRERDELDAILPALLSELGFTVYSRPQRGTAQHGVDVAAVSPDTGSGRKLYLLSIKKGDLTRQEWDSASPQALRASLNAILDAYIPARIPPELAGLPIVICICIGGDVEEQVRQGLTGFTTKQTTEKISFEEWNGDRLANLLLEGILREDLLPKPLRADFQKAVALLDEPEVSYRHFARLMRQLLQVAAKSERARVRVARQIYVCLWVLYVWSRDGANIEAPYRASEFAILSAWELFKPVLAKDGADRRALAEVIDQLIHVHLMIATEFIDTRIAPASKSRDSLGMAVASRTAVDVNIKLFDVLGRIGMTGLMWKWIGDNLKSANTEKAQETVTRLYDIGMSMIESNEGLHLPVSDDQALDIALFLLLCLGGAQDGSRMMTWLASMVERLDFTVRCNGRYPTCFSEYTDLIEHPRQRTQEYFEEATAGSTLVPLLACWTSALGRPKLATRLARLKRDKLNHCTMQLWTPGSDSEVHLYVNSDAHGSALTDLPIEDAAAGLLEVIAEACKAGGLQTLSAARAGAWPIVLMACRHWRLPVPPDFYVEALISNRDSIGNAQVNSASKAEGETDEVE